VSACAACAPPSNDTDASSATNTEGYDRRRVAAITARLSASVGPSPGRVQLRGLTINRIEGTFGLTSDSVMAQALGVFCVTRRSFVRRLALTMSFAIVSLNLVFTAPASAATPTGLLDPGSYPIDAYEFGTFHVASIDVTNAGDYVQRFNLPSGPVSFFLRGTTNSLQPYYVYLTQLYVGGLYFTSNGNTSGSPVLFRPYVAQGTLLNNASWSSTLYSTSGGVGVTQTSTVRSIVFLRAGGQNVATQEISTVMNFFGNAVGTLYVTQWETPANPHRMRTDTDGDLTILGQAYSFASSLVLGGLTA
jgi:hypothetical protein